ncbi:MAG TPA: hypothetical protein VGD86_10155 [Devosia sp.]
MASKDQIVRMMGLSAPETMPEAALDDEGVRGVDVGVELSPADELEAGIAAVFDAIRSGDDSSDDGADSDHTPPDDSGVTFALLTELNRLWERPPV